MLPSEFKEHYMPVPNSGCWIWMSTLNGSGYGRFHFEGKRFCVHRFAYERLVGKIPVGLDLDHKCRVRCCVNPHHLEPVTRSENVLRGLSPYLASKRSNTKEYCKHGHRFTKENSYVDKNGWKRCRICRREGRRVKRKGTSPPRSQGFSSP